MEEGDNDEDDDHKVVRKLQVQFVEGLASGEEEGVTEYVGLEDVMLIAGEDRKKRKHRSRSRSDSSEGSSSHKEQRRHHRSRSRSPLNKVHN